MLIAPTYCRREAYELFAAQLRSLTDGESLLRAAIAVSMHALDDANPQHVIDRIDALASEVRCRARSKNPTAIVAHLHALLFDEEEFRGNTDDYYSPLNSYVPAVLESRRGLPITLSLVYKSVAARAGLRVDGINSPGHFLVRTFVGNDVLIVDPFFAGRVLSPFEALERVSANVRSPLCPDMSLLPTATPLQWLTRILGNLRSNFASCGCLNDLAAMNELAALLPRVL